LLLIAVVIDPLVLMRRIQRRPVLPAHHWLFGSAHTQKRSLVVFLSRIPCLRLDTIGVTQMMYASD
jgi:hypothetical protein